MPGGSTTNRAALFVVNPFFDAGIIVECVAASWVSKHGAFFLEILQANLAELLSLALFGSGLISAEFSHKILPQHTPILMGESQALELFVFAALEFVKPGDTPRKNG